MTSSRPVAMLDSGLGGLTVFTELRRILPDVDVIYFADTANVPYGDRPLAEVSTLARQIIEHLRSYDPSLVIVASGTTCAAFAQSAWTPDDVATLGVVASGAEAALEQSSNGRVGVVATTGTIASGIFERKLKLVAPGLDVISVAAPKLVPLVESGAWASDAARDAVEECCLPFRNAGCDAVILGCTHFPHLRRWFEQSLGAGVAIVDPAIACARAAVRMLGSTGGSRGRGELTFEVSGDSEKFAIAAYDLAGVRATRTRRVDVALAVQAARPK